MAQRPPKRRPTPSVVSLSKDTLNELMPALDSFKQSLDLQVNALDSINNNMGVLRDILTESAEDEKRNADLKDAKNASLLDKFINKIGLGPKKERQKEDTTITGGVSRGLQAGIGGGLGFMMKLAGVGVGIASVGVGIAGFITAMAGADAAARKLGTGDHLVELLGNTAKGLSQFNLTNGAALAGLLATGGLFGAVGGAKKAGLAAVGMTALGLGIGGFIGGLALGSEVLDIANVDLSAFPEQAKQLADGLNAFSTLSPAAAGALGGLLATGGLFAAFSGLGTSVKMAVGMTAIGAGLGGFMSALATTGGLAAMAGFDGEGFATVAGNIAEGLGAFSNRDMAGLAGLFAVGSIFGAVPGGLAVQGMAALGATAMGLGIGGFVSGIALGGGLASLLGSDGSSLKTILVNLATGMKSFNGIKGDNFEKLGLGMAGLGAGIGALFVSLGANGVVQGINNLKDNFMGFFTGKEVEEAKSPFEALAEMIKPLEKVDFSQINDIDGPKFKSAMTGIADGLNAYSKISLKTSFRDIGVAINQFMSGEKGAFNKIAELGDQADDLREGADALERIADAMVVFSNIKFDSNQINFEGMAKKLAQAIPLLRGLAKGGIVGEGFFDGPEIDFGKGLIDNPDIDLNKMATAMRQVNEILGSGALGISNDAARTFRTKGQMGRGDGGSGDTLVKGGDNFKGGDTYITNNYTTNNFSAKTPANMSLVGSPHN